MAGLLCFASGWGIDSLIAPSHDAARSRSGLRVNSGPPLGGALPALKADAARRPDKPAATSNAVPSVDDLIELVVGGQETASRARVDRALAGQTAPELAVMGRRLNELKKGDAYPEWRVLFVARALAERGVVAALEFIIEKLGIDSQSYAALMTGMQRIFASDLPEATRLMAKPGWEREAYIDARWKWIFSLKGKAPPEALATIVEFDMKTRNDVFTADALGEFPERWVSDDPAGAMTWALSLPPCVTRRNILQRMAAGWAKTDAGAAQAFLDGIPIATLPNGALKSNLTMAVENVRKEHAPAEQ